MSSESRARVNQMRGCFEVEIILPDGKFQYFKPHALNLKEAIQEIALYIEGIQETNEGYVILWRFVGQQSFYYGKNIVAEPKFRTFLRKVKDYEEVVYETEKKEKRGIDMKKDNIWVVSDDSKEQEIKEQSQELNDIFVGLDKLSEITDDELPF